MSHPPVSLVVPNYNGRALLSRHVPSWLAAAEAYPGEAEVVVVDDGSADDSCALLRSDFPGVRLVVHPENRGFGPACWTGATEARHELVVLLNSDVHAEEDFLAPLVRGFEDPKVFSVSPLILDREGRPSKITVNHPRVRRGELKWDGVSPEVLLRLSRLPWETPLEIHSLFGLGGALAFRRERFVALGGFDPLLRPFYHEDVDLGLSAWRRGWTVRVEPRSRVTHEDGGTISRHFAPFRVKVARRRHRLLCQWKHAEGSWWRAHVRNVVLRVLTRWLRLDARFYAALWGALRRWPEARRARANERAHTVQPLEQAFRDIPVSWERTLKSTPND